MLYSIELRGHPGWKSEISGAKGGKYTPKKFKQKTTLLPHPALFFCCIVAYIFRWMKDGSASISPIIQKISVLPLAAVIFFTVSGGPYGLEPLIGYAGTWAIPLLMITPLLWDVPMILAVLELNSMMPVEGGYYEWVKRGLGIRWAFMEGWWTWLYSFVDLAIYPVLFVEYASFFVPGLENYKTPICLAVIWSIAVLNIRGIVLVGRTALLLTGIVMIPFAILYFTGFLHPAIHAQHSHSGVSSLSMALFTIMWNCLGWDNATTYAGEVNRPVRSYLKAIMLAFSAVYLFYISFTWLAIRSGIDPVLFADKGVPYLGIQIGGQSLGSLLSLGGMASMLGIFCAVMLSVSRVPAVMGKDKLLPPAFTRTHKKYNTPYISIIICSGIVSLLVLRPLADLLIMDICLYAAGISLEFISLIRLRKSAATDLRPFRIPLQKRGLTLLFSAPVLVFTITLGTALAGPRENLEASVVAILAILSAPLAWIFIGKNKRPSAV